MSNWVYDKWIEHDVSDVRVPMGQVWLINPGESIEVIGPSGTRQEVTIKPPQVVKIVNVKDEGKCEQ